MNQSQSIANLAGALARAQAKIRGAVKDSANPFFKSSYADLQSVWDACRGPLTENGLCVIQTTDENAQGTQLVTTLAHESGEFVSGRMPVLPLKNEPQAIGSAISYARRYALAAIVGVYQTDDDAETAQARVVSQNHTNVSPAKTNPAQRINEVVRGHNEVAALQLAKGAHPETQKLIAETIDKELTKETAQADSPGTALLKRREAEAKKQFRFPSGPHSGKSVADLSVQELSSYGLELENKLADKGLDRSTAPAPIADALYAIAQELGSRSKSAANASATNQKG